MSEELAYLTTMAKKQILDLRDSFLLVICERRNHPPAARNHSNEGLQ